MTYHPKQIMPAALFLATKTENYHIYLRDYAARLSSNPKRPVTAEDVLAPEFLLTQALRFTFDVRHPHRGLKGAYMELLSLADGSAVPAPAQDDASAHPFDAPALRDAMHRLPLPLPPPRAAGAAEEQMTDGEQTTGGKTDGKMKQDTGEATGDATGEDTGENAGEKSGKNTTQNGKGRAAPVQHAALVRRLEAAYGRASDTLKSAAVLSDAYFRYTPAQIWLAALLLADEPVAAFYLDTKLAPPLHAKVLGTLRRCAALLDATAASPVDRDRDELVRIDKKLYRCRNPDKVDLVGLNRVQKRDGAADGDVSGSAVKKRKLEREKQEKEGDDLFGPSLSQ